MLDITSPLEMALAYAGKGWSVFPLHTVVDGVCDCRKKCGSPGKHPRTINGFKGATIDPYQIRSWWEMWPVANIGIATGEVSGLLVVDIDPRNGGWETAEALSAAGTVIPATAKVRTQGGGVHLYYRYPGKKTKGSLGAGIDVKSDGGYVVAPPSVGMEGIYAWVTAMEPVAL